MVVIVRIYFVIKILIILKKNNCEIFFNTYQVPCTRKLSRERP